MQKGAFYAPQNTPKCVSGRPGSYRELITPPNPLFGCEKGYSSPYPTTLGAPKFGRLAWRGSIAPKYLCLKPPLSRQQNRDVKIIITYNQCILNVPFDNAAFGARSSTIAFPKIWNSLPTALCACNCPHSYRRRPLQASLYDLIVTSPSASDSTLVDHCARL